MRRIARQFSTEQLEAELKSGKRRLEMPVSVLATLQGEHAVLLDYARGKYFGLNEVASFTWLQLRKGIEFTAVVDAVATEYEVARDVASHDVAAMLCELQAAGIICVR